jgi:cbb3-type cytochrome oxidase maturation protein
MTVLYILVPFAMLLGGFFLGAFLWAARKGQFDDLVSPAHRILIDEETFTTLKAPKDSGGENV